MESYTEIGPLLSELDERCEGLAQQIIGSAFKKGRSLIELLETLNSPMV